jgi:translation elongation factor EF-Tu-like GTPase
MSPATTKESDSRFNIILIGHVDAEKTTLAAALTKASGIAVPYSKIKAAPEEKTGAIKGAKVSRVDFESDRRLHTLFDCPAHKDHEKLLKSGQVPIQID